MRSTTDARIETLLALIDQAYNCPAWHGTNLRGSVRGVGASRAARRPAPRRHNVWEVAVHAAYWKYIVRRRLTGERRGSFPLKGSNWFVRPERPGGRSRGRGSAEAAWRADLRLLDEMHASLRTVVAALEPAALDYVPAGSRVSNFAMISGIAAHDLYHAGQIQLLKRIVKF